MREHEEPIVRIGPLAHRYGVSPESLRVWERAGNIPPAHRTPGGHRRYGPEHVRALNKILRPLHPWPNADTRQTVEV